MKLFLNFCGLFLVLLPASTWACPVCRPRVQAAIHGPGFAQQLGMLLLPVGVLLLVGVGVFFAPAIRRRFTFTPAPHD
ncbi:hypothetical protein HER32_14025 [Hymenobacter sp. BT18]|uniref:hypothetical protein n=1 Tax=Hymenobacter sp. BT18 TaxID=2835648 RepID=UPI00143EAEDC|nr:hypothetical protein [Hymenobacter sp. BT18]QIX62236.1 hypothetical protein HER32_14025 [Hymenobacter sp. BT18]